MSKKQYTGNAFLDRLTRGPYVPNPAYNPKTKKGRLENPTLVDTSTGSISSGGVSGAVDLARRIQFTGTDAGLSNEQIEEDAEQGIALNIYDSDKERQKARADRQSNWDKFGNFVSKAAVGEFVLGSLEGFGDILNGIQNSITGNNYGSNPYTDYMRQLKEEWNNNHKIHQANPDENWQVDDFGWWMENAVSLATTASLLIPAAGIARGVSMLGKLSGAAKLGNWAARATANTIAKAATKLAGDTGRFASIAGKAGRIESAIKSGAEIGSMAYLQRTGENFMEAKEVYSQIKDDAAEKLNAMDTNEFNKFISMNKKFAGMSKEDIANQIANESADKTFYNDYWMLLMDAMQFKALGSLFGRGINKATTAGQRIAAENVRRTLAGKTEEQLIKNTWLNRRKDDIINSFRKPLDSTPVAQLSEGFEEIFQGIQTEKGKEVAKKYLDPNHTNRTFANYMTDGHIWEQGFWGWLGGMGFTVIGGAIQETSKAIKGAYNKKHMSAEDYERWKRTGDKQSIEQLNNFADRTKTFIEEMEQINNGANPYDFVVDPSTGRVVVKDGTLQNESIDDIQKDLLKQHAIQKLIDANTLDAIDNGTYDLLKGIVESNEFNKYIEDNGGKFTAQDRELARMASQRMEVVNGIYERALSDIYDVVDTSGNPYTAIAAARSITNNTLALDDYEQQLANVDARLAEEQENSSHRATFENSLYQTINQLIAQEEARFAQVKESRKKGKISDAAYRAEAADYANIISNLTSVITNETVRGAAEQAVKDIQAAAVGQDVDISGLTKTIDNIISLDAVAEPAPGRIEKLHQDKTNLLIRKAFTKAAIPTKKADYTRMYNEFAMSMDAYARRRTDDYLDKVRNYLLKAKDFEAAVKEILADDAIADPELNKVLKYLRYGYRPKGGTNIAQIAINTELDAVIAAVRKERKNREAVDAEAEKNGVVIPESNDDSVSSALSANQRGSQGASQPIEPNQPIEPTRANPVTDETSSELAQTSPQTAASNDDVLSHPSTGEIPVTASEGVQQGQPTQPQQAPTTNEASIESDAPIDTENPIARDEQATAAPGEVVDVAPEPEPDGMEPEVLEALDSDFNTPQLRAEVQANEYIMRLAFAEKGRIDSINKGIENNDTGELNNLIEEVKNFLINQGFGPNIASYVATNQFSKTMLMLAEINGDNVFKNLAHRLAIGFNESGAAKNSITDLIDGAGINEILEEFMELYIKEIGATPYKDGKVYVDIRDLIDFIISDININSRTAAYIYNNVFKYIAKNDNSKYVFVGYNAAAKVTAAEFINKLIEHKAEQKLNTGEMHVHLVERENRDKHFNKALEAIAKGATPTARFVEDPSGENRQVSIEIVVDIKVGNRTKTVKLATLRTVNANSDLTQFTPNSHFSGYRNVVTINPDGTHSLSCDDLFYGLIRKRFTDTNYREVFDILHEYNRRKMQIISMLNMGDVSRENANKMLRNLLTIEESRTLAANPVVRQLFGSEEFKPFNLTNALDADSAENIHEKIRQFTNTTANILFHDHHVAIGDIRYDLDTSIAINTKSMEVSYEMFKKQVFDNYKYTYEIAKALNNTEEDKVGVAFNVKYYVKLNTHENAEDYSNVRDVPFDTREFDENGNENPMHTPFVMVDKQGNLIDEHGRKVGKAPLGINTYSMGYVVFQNGAQTIVGYLNTAQQMVGSGIAKEAAAEVQNIIDEQWDRTDDDEDAYDSMFERINSLLGVGGLLYSPNVKIYAPTGDNFFSIVYTPPGRPASEAQRITIYKNNRDGTSSRVVSVTIPGVTKGKNKFGSENYTNPNNSNANSYIKSIIDGIFADVKLNKSSKAFAAKNDDPTNKKVFGRENGKFVVRLNNRAHEFDNYGDFIKRSGAFNTDVDGSSGKMVTAHIDDRTATIVGTVSSTPGAREVNNTDVSDLLYNHNNERKQKFSTKDVMQAARIPDEFIEFVRGNQIGVPLVVGQVYIDTTNDTNANAYYDITKDRIYITAKGAETMNNNPLNALRLILHENIHRHFNKKGTYTEAEKERIVEELKEVYEYTRAQLDADVNAGRLSQERYQDIIRVLNQATSNSSDRVNMEEFLVEALTQPALINYLNNTEYHSGIDIAGIEQTKKSLLQKIIDLLLKLFNVPNATIRNNSILARQYVILSKTINKTGVAPAAAVANAERDKTNSPVEEQPASPTRTAASDATEKLDAVQQQLDAVKDTFSKRIQRSDNFAEDHTYYIDGKPVDTSVTQAIHGKQDIGSWGVPSSAIGNSLDDAARVYFMNNGSIPDNHHIPNTTNEDDLGLGATDANSNLHLKQELDKLKEYLDNRFGAGQYRVVTEEFPIGGTIEVDGQIKTIAGTMDMVVYTADGDIYIFDFKTKRVGRSDGNLSQDRIDGYSKQVNIYRQLIESNFPHLEGRVKLGGLIVFNTNYPSPTEEDYRHSPSTPNQLQVKRGENYVDIQDADGIEYTAPFLNSMDAELSNSIVQVETKQFDKPIGHLPNKDAGKPDVEGVDNSSDDSGDAWNNDEWDDDYQFKVDDDVKYVNTQNAITDLIVDGATHTELQAMSIANNGADNGFGVTLANDMGRFVGRFPTQHKAALASLMAADGLNYTCQ